MDVLFAIAQIIGQLATLSQPRTPDEAFIQGQVEWSVPVVSADFIGQVWVCDPEAEGYSTSQVIELKALASDPSTILEEEMCYAGLSDGELITGP